MRADRLVAILMLLQVRGQVTAAEVAAELEISERTARRDLDALGLAGVPIYSVPGRGGGWRLAGGGRTDLSGLTTDEARALFLVAGPVAGASPTPELKAALRKLLRALPEPLREGAEAASRSTVVDPRGWEPGLGGRPPPPQLATVQRAVVEGEQLRIAYTARDGTQTVRTVHPLGIATKGSTWYLVASTDAGLRTFRVDRIDSSEATGEPVVRPDGFELTDAWRQIEAGVEQMRTPVHARARTRDAAILGPLRSMLGRRASVAEPAADGTIEVALRGHHVESLAWELAGFGSRLEVLDPPELRTALAAIGADLVATYP